MNTDNLANILNNLCNMFIDDGTTHEEVIEMMIDAGADVEVLKGIGFTETQIRDYAYYEGMMSNRTEDEVATELGL